MCQALREENPNHTNELILDRVTKDCLEKGLAKQTVTHNIPEEFKDAQKVAAGKKGAEEKKKKLLLTKKTSGASETEAENTSNDEKEPKSGSSEKPEINRFQEIYPPNPDDEDEETKDKRLAKKDEIIQKLQEEKEQALKKNAQLEAVIKKDAFTPATKYTPPPKEFNWPEPDNNNTFVWKEITFDSLRKDLGPLKASGNTKINVYLERVI